ncbi:Uncharacterised protein [Bordetella pertussis]|nr:Uncharacterised protein [Bordetella pertussis]
MSRSCASVMAPVRAGSHAGSQPRCIAPAARASSRSRYCVCTASEQAASSRGRIRTRGRAYARAGSEVGMAGNGAVA